MPFARLSPFLRQPDIDAAADIDKPSVFSLPSLAIAAAAFRQAFAAFAFQAGRFSFTFRTC